MSSPAGTGTLGRESSSPCAGTLTSRAAPAGGSATNLRTGSISPGYDAQREDPYPPHVAILVGFTPAIGLFSEFDLPTEHVAACALLFEQEDTGIVGFGIAQPPIPLVVETLVAVKARAAVVHDPRVIPFIGVDRDAVLVGTVNYQDEAIGGLGTPHALALLTLERRDQLRVTELSTLLYARIECHSLKWLTIEFYIHRSSHQAFVAIPTLRPPSFDTHAGMRILASWCK